MQTVRYTWVDVFSVRPFSGNRLCVFEVPDGFPLAQMQAVTQELSHSETTFLQPAVSAGADYRVRILMPGFPQAVEIPFAGHPILGSACVAAASRPGLTTVRFETGVGNIAVEVGPVSAQEWAARMEQPYPRTTPLEMEPAAIARALGLTTADLHPSLPTELAYNGLQTALIPLASVAAVARATANYPLLRAKFDTIGVLLFAFGGTTPEAHVHCRLFIPELGVEDPATGSANGPLGEYLVRHGLLREPLIRSEQGCEMGRPSQLTIEVERDRVFVGGRVHLVGRGEFMVG